MPIPAYTVADAPVEARATYLKSVLGITMLGLGFSAITGIASTAAFAVGLATAPGLFTGFLPLVVILGCWAVSNFVAQPMVFGGAKWVGFFLGTAAQGVAMGYLLLMATLVSLEATGSILALPALALGLTGFTGVGLTAYAYTKPREFSMIGAGLAAMSIPMLILMAVGIAFPGVFGGVFGILIGGLFVVISAAGLLYQLNNVIHRFDTSMTVEGAYTITMGLLVLFWNILSLLMRLTRR